MFHIPDKEGHSLFANSFYETGSGFAALLFFAVTGITLNHPEWIEGKQKVERVTGTIDPAWADRGDITTEARDEIVEHIRNAHNIRACNDILPK